MFNPPYVITST